MERPGQSWAQRLGVPEVAAAADHVVVAVEAVQAAAELRWAAAAG